MNMSKDPTAGMSRVLVEFVVIWPSAVSSDRALHTKIEVGSRWREDSIAVLFLYARCVKSFAMLNGWHRYSLIVRRTFCSRFI
jgi:hypothetical protein